MVDPNIWGFSGTGAVFSEGKFIGPKKMAAGESEKTPVPGLYRRVFFGSSSPKKTRKNTEKPSQ
jgi:hypothetical protein